MAAQRKQLFDIMRNDVFHAEKHVRESVARLQKHGVSADQIHTFEEKAARVSTPKQIADIERELMS